MDRSDRRVDDFANYRSSRRRFLAGAVAAGVAAPMFGKYGHSIAAAQEGRNKVVWVSPRGSLETIGDYAYWVAKEMGYFGDIETVMLPAILESTSSAKNVADGDADVSYVSPGVFADAVSNGLDLISAFQMSGYDAFDFALPKGNPLGIQTAKDLEGKTVVLADIGWAAIVDPLIIQAGGDPSKVNYVAAGPGYAQTLEAGKADAALSWEGQRAEWDAAGLDFDYILGYEWSIFPGNPFEIRRSDFEDESLTELYTNYFKGWAMGLEFAYQNPVAATQITLAAPEISASLNETFPDKAEAVHALWEIANIFRGNWDKRNGGQWGWADLEGWQAFFDDSAKASGAEPIDASTVVSNKYIDGVNDFDRDQVIADARDYELSEEYAAIPLPADAGLSLSAS